MRTLVLVLLTLTLWTLPAQAQQWSGILDSSRAIDWSTVDAGVTGGIPTRTTICQTLNPGATAPQINTAIQNCPAGQVVKLNAGTYTVGPITFNGKSNVTLRGAGPGQTIIKSTDAGGCIFPGAICIVGTTSIYGGGPGNIPATGNSRNWTGGFAKGSTQLTLSNTTGIGTGMILALDQVDDLPGQDTGGIYQCAAAPYCSTEGGPQGRHDPADGRNFRTQMQFVKVVSVDDGTHVTITPPLYMNNWRASQNPQAWWWGNAASTAQFDGIEDLTIDGTSIGLYYNISISNAYNSWVKNVRSINSPRAHIGLVQSAHSEVRNSYFYGTRSGASTSYGIESFATGGNLVINNIAHNVTTPLMGPSPGSVFAYNYFTVCRFRSNPAWNASCIFAAHDSGGGMELFEGNQTASLILDSPHGTSGQMTLLRNHFYGVDDAAGIYPLSSQHNIAVDLHALSRANNVLGNVLGKVGATSVYEDSPWPSATGSNSDSAVFSLGYSVTTAPNDTVMRASLLRWGNWDAVTQSARFVNTEIPTTAITFVNANAIPSTQTIPNSFFLSGRPSAFWTTPWGTPAWPPIGGDVTGGTMPNSGGHAYKIPAKLCFDNTPVDTNYPVDTAGDTSNVRVLLFNPGACYGQASGDVTPPATPTSLTVR